MKQKKKEILFEQLLIFSRKTRILIESVEAGNETNQKFSLYERFHYIANRKERYFG
jgi:hypothetical protein